MSQIPLDLIKVIAETIGVQKLADDVAVQLAVDLEYRMREILQDSIKMMRHCKRTLICTEDINSVLSLQNYEILYGYSYNKPMNYIRVVGHKDLFCLEENDIPLIDIMNEPLPSVPKEVLLESHWLVVDGVQPVIAQNLEAVPSLSLSEKEKIESEEKAKVGGGEDEGGKAKTPAKRGGNNKKKIEPKKVEKRKLEAKKDENPSQVKHVLSKELELYFFKVTEVLQAVGKNMTEAQKNRDLRELYASVLSSIKEDHGVHQLVPYFSKFIVGEVSSSLTNLNYLKTLMEFTDSFLLNPNFRLELYLTQLMPSILTCLLGKKLCTQPEENHWALRDYVAKQILPKACRIGKDYFEFQVRVIKTLANTFLDPTKPLTSHYGAVKGLESMGVQVVQLTVLPNLCAYMKMLNAKKESYGTILNAPKQFIDESAMVQEALLEIASEYLKSMAEYYKNLYSLLCMKNLSEIEEERDITASNTTRTIGQRKEEREKELGPENKDFTLQLMFDMVRQEAVNSTDSVAENLALGELAELGKRYQDLRETFGVDLDLKLIAHREFFLSCSEWQSTAKYEMIVEANNNNNNNNSNNINNINNMNNINTTTTTTTINNNNSNNNSSNSTNNTMNTNNKMRI
jgi:transcription initiation factor TFIID subunit 6